MNDVVELSGRPGRFAGVPAETIEKMQELRLNGKSIREISEIYPFSENTIRKYTDRVLTKPIPPVNVKNESDADDKVQKEILSKHAGKVLDYAKRYDGQVIEGGEAFKKFLESKGITIDLDKVPREQLLKLVQSPGLSGLNSGDTMKEEELKSFLDRWLHDNKGDTSLSFEKIQKYLDLRLMMKLIGDDGGNKSDDKISQLIAENEKLRQDFRAELEKNRQEMRDLVLEKRLRGMEGEQADIAANLSQQLDGLHESLAQLKQVPNPSPAQKTALDELSDAVAQINKIKGSLTTLGVVSAAPGSVSTQPSSLAELETFRNPDGSLNTIALGLVKGADALKTFLEAKAKQAPEPGTFVETPPPSAGEKYVTLCGLPESARTPAENEFMCEYEADAYQTLKGRQNLSSAQLGFVQKYEAMLQKQTPSVQVVEPPVAAHAVPEPTALTKPIEPAKPTPESKISIIDRLKAAEEQQSRAFEGVL